MRIVFMGTPAFAARSLQKLIDDGYDIPEEAEDEEDYDESEDE